LNGNLLQAKYLKYYLLSLAVILVDQTVKMLVHFNMEMGLAGQIPLIDDWFKLHYTLNPGMAFGMQLGFKNDKLILTLVRLGAMVGIAYYIIFLIKKQVKPGLVWCVALILGGAIGNVIDSTFYGIWLDNAPHDATTPWFHGQVVDMFYFDIWEGRIYDWIPYLGGSYLSLWPIFNVADASIFMGVLIILIMQGSYFSTKKEETEPNLELTDLKSTPDQST